MVTAVLWTLLVVSPVCHGLAHADAEKHSIFAQVDIGAEPVSDSATATPTVKQKLDRRTRIELLFVLLMLVAVGLGLIAFTWLTARLTRRYMKPSERRPTRPVDPVFTDDWAAKPLTEQERARLDSSEW